MNDWYNHGGAPSTSAFGSSATLRAEFEALQTMAEKLPPLDGFANGIVIVNAANSGLYALTISEFLVHIGITSSIEELNNSDVSSVVMLLDDFLGGALNSDLWYVFSGTDPQALDPFIVGGGVLNGYCQLNTGDDAAGTMAINGSFLAGPRSFYAQNGGMVFECRLYLSDITNICVYVGFTDDNSSLEMPFTLGPGNTLTSNATYATGFLFDTAADTDNIWLVGVSSDIDAPHQDSSLAYVASTHRTLRVEISITGVATFYIDGVLVGSPMAGAIGVNQSLSPCVAVFSRNAAQKVVEVDYILARNNR